ncbi:DddA-like double-stranded DNA deaminase toxin [Saccharopolyspora hattusasensis]|uniref:DddA-like double-stranded DNA deaminase toxin n=1 Tax=Saccharopolyspora hattusasensis TaxID=1128679 RepID=UPI003D98C870
MSALTETISKLHSALSVLPDGAVQEAHQRLADDLLPRLAALAAGTHQASRLAAAHVRLAALPVELDQVRDLLQTVRSHTEEWINQHGGTAAVSAASSRPAAALGTSERTTAGWVAAYRARLEHPWPYGKPLQGWRLAGGDGSSDRELASGTKLASGQTDPSYTAAVQRARELGLARGGFVPDIARHIEIKEASTMTAGETRTIVIGKDPCGIDPVTNVSCHRFLRYFLPPGATLIVYGPRGEPYRYEGKRTS